MRIKHWAGYGCVNAKATKRSFNTWSKIRTLTIEVKGLHECGLDRSHDKYDCFNWLLKRFDKNVANLNSSIIKSISYYERWDADEHVDVAHYTFTYEY